jgi:hypothetical protein
MNSFPQESSSGGSEATTSTEEARSATAVVKSFLLQNEPTFRRLDELREKVSVCLSGIAAMAN